MRIEAQPTHAMAEIPVYTPVSWTNTKVFQCTKDFFLTDEFNDLVLGAGIFHCILKSSKEMSLICLQMQSACVQTA